MSSVPTQRFVDSFAVKESPLPIVEQCNDDLAITHVQNTFPFLLKNQKVCSLSETWSIDYFINALNLGHEPFMVFETDSKKNKFLYYNIDIAQKSRMAPAGNVTPKLINLCAFMQSLKHQEKTVPYLQAPIHLDPTQKNPHESTEKLSKIVQETTDWEKIDAFIQAGNWGPLCSSTLFISGRNSLTQLHFDEYHNLLFQLKGSKRILLFPPDDYVNLYPFPTYHPNDRQSQVDLEIPNFSEYPLLQRAKGYEVVLNSGDMLFMPGNLWHHVQSMDEENISLNFWFEANEIKNFMTDADVQPQAYSEEHLPLSYLSQARRVEMARRIETSLVSALGNPIKLFDNSDMVNAICKQLQLTGLWKNDDAIRDFLKGILQRERFANNNQ